MSNVAVFVGLDYHQDSVQVSVLDASGRQLFNRSCANDWQQIAKVVQPLGTVQRVAIEACCGAADLAEELVARLGWQVDLAHPQYVARMKQSPDKTDYSDGRMLADLTRVGYLPRVWLASAYDAGLEAVGQPPPEPGGPASCRKAADRSVAAGAASQSQRREEREAVALEPGMDRLGAERRRTE